MTDSLVYPRVGRLRADEEAEDKEGAGLEEEEEEKAGALEETED